MQTNCRHKHVGCTVGKSEDMNATLQVTENYDLSYNTAIAKFMPLSMKVQINRLFRGLDKHPSTVQKLYGAND